MRGRGRAPRLVPEMMDCCACPRNRDPRGPPIPALQSPLKRIKISLYARGRLASRTEMGTLPTSMPISAQLPFEIVHGALKAAGEATRLRILALLAEAELTVSELTAILRQSQPRIRSEEHTSELQSLRH